MVLSAGLGTRLQPLTEQLPKPLVPVGDRSVLAHISGQLAAAMVSRLVLNVHHRAGAFDEALLEALPLRARVVREPEILGTAGGVANARVELGQGDVLVWNGDILAEVDLPALLAEHRRHGALATLAACARAGGGGTLGLDSAGLVARLRGEHYGVEDSAMDFVGIQVISQALRDRLPALGCLVGDGYQPALQAGESVRAVPVVRGWCDVGSLASYLKANLQWLADKGRSSFVAADAQVGDRVMLGQAVVCSRARVEGEGGLRRVVVWPGARARAPLCDAVVMSSGRVVTVRP